MIVQIQFILVNILLLCLIYLVQRLIIMNRQQRKFNKLAHQRIVRLDHKINELQKEKSSDKTIKRCYTKRKKK